VRRRWWVVLSFVVVGAIIGWAAGRSAAPSYREHVSIWIARGDRGQSAAAAPARALDASGWIELATSFAVLDRVVTDAGLVARTADSVVATRQAADALRKRLVVSAPDSNFIVAELRGSNPAQDARILNSLGREVIAAAAGLGQPDGVQMLAALEAQLKQATSALESAEDALNRFRVRAITLPSEQSVTVAMDDPTASEYFASTAAADSVRRERAALERVVANVRRHRFDMNALLAIPSARNAPELMAAAAALSTADSTYQAYRLQSTQTSVAGRQVSARIATLERKTIPTLGNQLLARMRTSQRRLTTQAAAARRRLEDIPRRTLEEARLRRDVSTKESIYNLLKARVDGLRLAQQNVLATASVLDSAVASPRSATDTRWRYLLAALAIALVVGVGAALLVDRFDPKLRYPEQVGDLDLHLLAAVPHMDRAFELDHSNEAAARAVDAFRMLRLNLSQRQPASEPVQLTITSPGASEGKSLLAANLALSFAEAGYRTLLIDGDVRRGKQHETFGATLQPGLTDFLAGKARADAIARRSTHPNLLIIPAGTRVGQAPELLMSPQLPRLLAAIRPLFNAIIVDSAPLGAGADALALGAATGDILLVLRTGATERRTVRSRLALLRHAPVRVVGAVLNDIGSMNVYDEYGSIDDYYIPMARTHEAGESLPSHVQVQPQAD
jgi:capsular exopolysaccharide synthesis family protein